MILLTLSRGKGEETVRLQLPASPAEIEETFAFLDRISLDTTATAILDVSSNVALPCFALVCTLLNICSVLPEKDGGYRGLRFDKCLGICPGMAFISESRDTTDA